MKTKQINQTKQSPKDCVWLYNRSVYDDAVMSGIIEDENGSILEKWQESPHLDIDTITKKPVRFLLCAEGIREWRDTMLWRRVYEEGVAYSTADHTTLSGMSIEALYDTYFYYATIDEDYSRTPWGYHFEKELELRETEK
jgi:hypothetical protein